MAEAAVGYLLEKLADALLKKAQELHAVGSQIEQIQKELRLIQALLRDADSKRNRDELVKEWLNQVRDMAHTIEDLIDTFMVEIEGNRSRWFNKIPRGLRKHNKMNKLAGELKNITQELTMIYRRRTELGITVLGAGSKENDHLTFRLTETSIHVDDSEVVGFEADKRNIIEQLLDSNISRRTVISIVGTGGLGKTTLAQKVYKSAELEGHFHCRTWLSISQNFSLNDLLRKILYSIEPEMRKQNTPMTDEDVLVQLESSLRHKRYLIILDDVWTTDLWEELKKTIPDPNNMSRIIITSRFVDVALVADCNTKPYELRYLNDDESLALLFRKAFQQHIQPMNYPPELLKVAEKLTKKCGGLPLALVVLGGILSKRERNYTTWSTKEESMDWHNEDGKKCLQILAMSYEDLPYKLKSCFLYFASFPEDYEISGKHITRMWVAEGFVPKDGGGTIEDRAEKCLEELVQRCLIKVTKKSWNGYCKYCSMHDLLRDLAICKSKKENFFTVFSKAEDVNQLAAIKPRRASLQSCTVTKDGVYSENTRSLLCFGFNEFSSDDCGFSKLNYSGFRLLRVLTLERVDMRKFARRQWQKGLIHLRYLGLRGCNIPHDMFKKFSFYNLETIDLKESEIAINEESVETIDLCNAVIPNLRHVYGGDFYLPLKWDQHTNLQTVNVQIQIELFVELGYCTNLRTLGIFFAVNLDNERALKVWENLKGVLRRTEQLVQLRIGAEGLLPFGGTIDLPCHEKIQKLYLMGKWGRNICVPSVEMFPANITKLTLIWSDLKEDPMPILERLQSLRILHLLAYSYVGAEMICSTRGFPNLEKLQLALLVNLRHWDIKEGAMPILTHLEINYCRMLHALPELQKVQTLQELLLGDPSRELRKSMQGKDLHKFEHIPSVCVRPDNYQ